MLHNICTVVNATTFNVNIAPPKIILHGAKPNYRMQKQFKYCNSDFTMAIISEIVNWYFTW